MQIVDFFHNHSTKLRGVVLAVFVPLVFLGGLFLVAKSGPDTEALRTAAIALDNFYNENPPNGVWEYQGVRIVDDKRLVIDVHVAVVPHATVIESRNKRIRFSYMKLACPVGDPIVEEWTKQSRVWINLHFHGKTLIEAACPHIKKDSLFAS